MTCAENLELTGGTENSLVHNVKNQGKDRKLTLYVTTADPSKVVIAKFRRKTMEVVEIIFLFSNI